MNNLKEWKKIETVVQPNFGIRSKLPLINNLGLI